MKSCIAMVLLSLGIVFTPAQAVNSDEFFLNSYLKDRSVKTLEEFLPRGYFLVQTSVKLKPVEAKEEQISLPLGGTAVKLSDLHDANSEPLQDLLARVDRIQISVQVESSVSAEIKKSIESALTATFYLDPRRGDKIDFQLLPEGWQSLWHPKPVPVAPTHTMEYTVLAACLALFLVLFLCFRGLQSGLTRAIRETNVRGDEAPAPMAPLTNAAKSPAAQEVSTASTSSHSFKNLDLPVLKAFSIDSFLVDEYQSVPRELLNGILPYELSSQLEDALPPQFLEANSDRNVGESVIRGLLFKSLSDYRSFSKSPLIGTLVQTDAASLIAGFLEFSMVERLMILKNVGPLLRERLIGVLPPKERLSLVSQVNSGISEKETEISLSAIQMKITKHLRAPVTANQQVFSKISKAMLHPFSFEEDEAFYAESRGNQSLAYTSVLEALEILEAADWNSLNLQDVAYAYLGYSDLVRKKLESKFEGKRREWLKSMFARVANQEKQHFAAFECVDARLKVMRAVADRRNAKRSLKRAEA